MFLSPNKFRAKSTNTPRQHKLSLSAELLHPATTSSRFESRRGFYRVSFELARGTIQLAPSGAVIRHRNDRPGGTSSEYSSEWRKRSTGQCTWTFSFPSRGADGCISAAAGIKSCRSPCLEWRAGRQLALQRRVRARSRAEFAHHPAWRPARRELDGERERVAHDNNRQPVFVLALHSHSAPTNVLSLHFLAFQLPAPAQV